METFNTSFEPMDIDMNSSINDNMDISFDQIGDDYEYASVNLDNRTPDISCFPVMEDINLIKSSTVKKYHINVPRDANKDYSVKNMKIVAIVIILAISMIIAQTLSVKCAEEMNVEQLRTDLYHKVYGQSKAINDLLDALQIKESKLLILFGGTGVGKTYTASIIMETFGHTSNLYHYVMPSFNTEFSVEFLLGLTICKNSMFIIDDLRKDDDQVITSVKDLLNKGTSIEKNVTVVLIYNCMNEVEGFSEQCDQYFHTQLLHNFEDINIIKKLIKFEPLSEKHLKKCIENEMGQEMIETNELRNVYKYFNVALDGCKGVHAKIKLYKGIK